MWKHGGSLVKKMSLILVDTHCHLDFHLYDEDREVVLQRARETGVKRIVIPALDVASAHAAIALAERYEDLYVAVGIHPNEIGPHAGPPHTTLTEIRALAVHPKVVAIGEIGLDYHWDKTPPAVQHLWLERQLDLAAELGLPVILHNREATADMLAVLAAWCGRGLPSVLEGRAGVLHSFSATWADAEVALGLGFYIGITGPITFKKADELREVAAKAPADRLLTETDGPFLAPHPHRGERNEPAYVRFIAAKLAEVRSVPLEEIATQTTHNATTLFGWE